VFGRGKNSNRLFYLGLIFLHSVLLLYVLCKKNNKREIFLTFLSLMGLTYLFEYPIYILKGYKYKTKILKNKEQDNSFGSVLSQGLFVPSAAIFISTFKFGWSIKLLLTVYFVLIERCFLKLNIYKNNWWRTTYTSIFIFTYFFISDAWYNGIRNGNKLILKLTLSNVFHVTYMNLLFLLSVFKKFKYQPVAFTTQPWYFHYSFVKIYIVIETLITTYFLEQKKKWKRILPIIITLISDSFFKKINILKLKGSYWVYLFPARIVPHLIAFLFKKWIKKYESHENKNIVN
jgi:hypothetical protein